MSLWTRDIIHLVFRPIPPFMPTYLNHPISHPPNPSLIFTLEVFYKAPNQIEHSRNKVAKGSENMSTVSSTRSAPPPYSTLPPPNLDVPHAGQTQQGQMPQQPQQFAQQYQQVQQYPTFPQNFILQPQFQPLFHQPQPTIPIFHPFPPGTIISPAFQIPIIHPIPFFPQPLQPLHLPIAPAPDLQNSNMRIIPAPTQAGFVPHPPTIIPGIPGVHQYPLFVSKEGEGPPPLPIFVGGYSA
jgi:hypothetical protein